MTDYAFDFKAKPQGGGIKLGDKLMIEVGRYSYLDNKCWIKYYGVDQSVIIGNFCSIASGVKFIWPQIHHPEYVTTYIIENFLKIDQNSFHHGQKKDIFIGNDVWIGDGVTILPGVKIADGCVVGAGAVVTKNLEPYGVYAGIPAKLMRFRFDEETIGLLLRSKWWDLPDEKIKEVMPLLFSSNILGFLRSIEVIQLNDA